MIEVKAILRLWLDGRSQGGVSEVTAVDRAVDRRAAHPPAPGAPRLVQVPGTSDFEAELPRLPTRKLHKRLLRDRYRAGHNTVRIPNRATIGRPTGRVRRLHNGFGPAARHGRAASTGRAA